MRVASIYDVIDTFTGPRYQTRMYETLRGEGDFWCTRNDRWSRPRWDNEQYLDVFLAVQRACACQMGPAERWKIVEEALARLASEYASDK